MPCERAQSGDDSSPDGCSALGEIPLQLTGGVHGESSGRGGNPLVPAGIACEREVLELACQQEHPG